MTWQSPLGDTEIRHGYTLTAVHQIARLAVHPACGWYALDYLERLDIAWGGIVDHLYDAEHWPAHHNLVRAGQAAVLNAVSGELHHAGFYRHKTDGVVHGPGSMPAFVKYWHRPPTVIEPRIVERFTLAQIWPALTPRQQDAITALAVHDDYALAAEALGIKPHTFIARIGRARRQFLELWHEGEQPSRMWRATRRVMRRATTDPAELEKRAAYAAQKREQRRAAAA